MNRHSPVLPRTVLRRLVPSERLEEIEGDLIELFQARLEEHGAWHARLRYWQDVASTVSRYRSLQRTDRIRRKRRNHLQPNTLRRGMGEAMAMMLLDAFNELKHASRVLAMRPGYAAIAVFTLALGLGANVTIFTVVNAVLLRPLPYPDSDRIVEITHHAPGLNMPEMQSSPGLIAQYRQNARTLSAIAAYDMRQLNVTYGRTPERVRAIAVTPELFDVLATRPAIGRPFREVDARKSGAPVTILTHALWQSRFGGDPGIVGRTVQLDGTAAEIVGVMPRGFSFPDPDTRLLVPLWLDPDVGFGAFGMASLARLAPGTALEAARTEIAGLQQRIPEWFPGLTADVLAGFGWSVSVEPLRDRVVAGVARTLWILFGTVGFVLLIAGANVANLFLVRAESRQRELAVRSALGASRSRIAGTFLAESLMLATIGGLAGVMAAAWATRLLVAYGPAQLPRLHEVRMDATVLGFAAILSALAAVALGMLAALSVARRPFTTVVRDGGRGSTAGRARHRVRRLLTVTQVATAVVLLVGSGLMLRSVARLNAVNPGFRVEGLVTAGVSLGAQTNRAHAVATYHRVLDEMARVPGVVAVGAANSLPIVAGGLNGSSFAIRSRPNPRTDVPLFTMFNAVTHGYFETLEVPLLEGRAPARADAEQDRPVAWVSKTFASRFLEDRAVGEWINIDERWLEVVGIVGDLKTFGLREEVKPMMYVPLSNTSVGLEVVHTVVRTSGGTASLASDLRSAVDGVDASVPLTTTRTMEDIVATSMAQTAFAMTLLAIAAGIALVLGVVGLYGVISYIVAQRTSEIGIRLALGARPGGVIVMVLRQGLIVAVAGVVVGLLAALASARLMASLLFEVSAYDPVTFTAVAVVLTAVSAAATYLPARRAASIDPVRALRQDG
jgi:putative ABC transport system permease protein